MILKILFFLDLVVYIPDRQNNQLKRVSLSSALEKTNEPYAIKIAGLKYVSLLEINIIKTI